jgi:hypothetical protein
VALRAAGRRAESDAEEARAIALWDAKGATLLADRARRDVAGAAATSAVADAPTSPPAIRRHVRPNAATANLERHEAAFAARDRDAVGALIAAGISIVDHTTGYTSESDEELAADIRQYTLNTPASPFGEPLATLGDTSRSSVALVGPRRRRPPVDVGPYEAASHRRRGRRERTPPDGRALRPDHLAAAVARLYERPRSCS